MLFDHVALRVIQLKVAVGIAQGRSGVPKPVQPVRGVGRVPIRRGNNRAAKRRAQERAGSLLGAVGARATGT